MATKLEKDVTRESNVIVDERNVIVTLTKDQEISMKLKGMKSGEVKTDIEDLYNQLAGIEETPKTKKSGSVVFNHDKPKKDKDEPMISLYDFRSLYLTSGDLPLEVKIKLEQITTRLIKNYKK